MQQHSAASVCPALQRKVQTGIAHLVVRRSFPEDVLKNLSLPWSEEWPSPCCRSQQSAAGVPTHARAVAHPLGPLSHGCSVPVCGRSVPTILSRGCWTTTSTRVRAPSTTKAASIRAAWQPDCRQAGTSASRGVTITPGSWSICRNCCTSRDWLGIRINFAVLNFRSSSNQLLEA